MTIESGSEIVPFPSGRVGALLSWLLAAPNQVHPAASLIEGLWRGTPAVDDERARARLHQLVNRLRQFLDDGEDPGLSLVTDEDGYRLVASADLLDSVAFEALAQRALGDEPELAPDALALWRGEPFTGLTAAPELEKSGAYLTDLRNRLDQAGADPGSLVALQQTFARTKFIRPAVDGPDILARQRLLDRAGKLGDSAVVVVSAPGGFGKSVFLSQWAEAQPGPVAWVSLDQRDSDPIRFWAAVLEAFQHAGGIETPSPAGVEPGAEQFLASLISGLSTSDAKLGLVLDDFHHLDNLDLIERLKEMFSLLPEWLTVAVSTRDPAELDGMDLNAIRLVTAADLRFDADEISALSGTNAPPPTEDRLARIEALTEGWPVAVAYLRRAGIDPEDRGRVAGDVGDYIVDEVLAGLPQEVHQFLLETAGLDRFNADLCDAVTGRSDAAELLAWLRRRDLFLTPIHEETGWHRYHSLVAEALRSRAAIDPGVNTTAAHQKAARWCLEHRLNEEALGYAIAADDDTVISALAGEVVWGHAMAGEVFSAERVVRAIDPRKIIGNRAAHDAVMFVVAAWLDPDTASRWIESRRSYGDDPDLMADFVKAHQLQVQGRPREAMALIDSTNDALDSYFEAHPNQPALRHVMAGVLGLARLCCQILVGELHHDQGRFDVLAAEAAKQGPLGSAWLLGEWAFLSYIEGAGELAQDLVDQLETIFGTMDRHSIDLGTTKGLAAWGLLHSDRATDPASQRRIVSRLEPVVSLYERRGWYTEMVPVLLALHVASVRAGDFEGSARYAAQADVLLDLCEEVPLLVRARNLLVAQADALSVGERLASLSSRQESVLSHLAAGLTYPEIAKELGLTLGGVRAAVRAIYNKLGVHSRHEAAKLINVRSADSDAGADG